MIKRVVCDDVVSLNDINEYEHDYVLIKNKLPYILAFTHQDSRCYWMPFGHFLTRPVWQYSDAKAAIESVKKYPVFQCSSVVDIISVLNKFC